MTPFRRISCGIELASGDAVVSGDELGPASVAALASAIRLARDDRASLHLLSALDLDEAALTMIQREHRAGRPTVTDRARQRLEVLAAGPRGAGVETTTEVSHDSPARALLADADRAGRDLIVVGTRERGAVARNLLGSTALRLLRRAPQPVWVARNAFGERPPVVLCAIEIGDMAPRILRAAAQVAARAAGELHVLHVVDFAAEDVLRAGAADRQFVLEYRAMKRTNAETRIPALVEETLGPQAKARLHLPDGDVDETILGTAESLGADVVVLGSVVHSLASAAISGLGRTAESVLPRVAASLLVLKPEPPAA
jgi:CPA2 family monovalent cation:H+ antiporter-2